MRLRRARRIRFWKKGRGWVVLDTRTGARRFYSWWPGAPGLRRILRAWGAFDRLYRRFR